MAAHLACESWPPVSLTVPEPRKPGLCLTQRFPPTDRGIKAVTGRPNTRLKPNVTSSGKPSYTSTGVLLSPEPPH